MLNSGPELAARKLSARNLAGRPPDTPALEFFFDTPDGRFQGTTLVVGRGRTLATVTAGGFDREFDPADVLALEDTLRARLRP
jgi:hypothetical protein